MTKQQVREILDRVLTWPAQRQEDAVRILAAMEERLGNDRDTEIATAIAEIGKITALRLKDLL